MEAVEAMGVRARSATGEENRDDQGRDQQPINREHNVIARPHVTNQEGDCDEPEDGG
jgi:hypothetical protein